MHTQETFPPQTPFAGFEAAGEAPMATHEALQANMVYNIDPNMPLATDEKYGCDIAAIITTDSGLKPGEANNHGEIPDSFIVLDLRRQPLLQHDGRSYRMLGKDMIDSSVEFMLVGKEYGEAGDRGYKGIRRGESVWIGRENENLKERFDLQDTTSRMHFTLKYEEDGKLSIQDHDSTNGTSVTTGAPIRPRVQWQSRAQQEEAFRPRAEEQAKPQADSNPYGFDTAAQRKFSELQRAFGSEMARGELDEGSLAGLLKHVGMLRAQGIEDDKIFKQIAREVHPDRAEAGSAEYLRRSALYKALGNIMGR